MRANMLFWPIIALSLVMVALYLAGPPYGGFLEADGAEQRRVYLIVLAAGVVIAAAGRILLRGGPGTVRHAALWITTFAVATATYGNRHAINDFYNRVHGSLYPSVAMSTTQGEAELRRAWDGHYRAVADINGVPVRLLIDTGATMVLLPYEVVHSLGIDPNTLEYTLPVTTANGRSTVAPVTLSSIKIGPIAVFDVPAAVAHPGRLKMGLLGMSFLDKLAESSFRSDRLILRN